jgi:tetratricopeptide (TPR) repeat protein
MAVGVVRAGEAAERAVTIYRELGDDASLGRALWARANAMYESRNWDAAVAILDEALPLLESSGDRFMLTWGRFMKGIAFTVAGDEAQARELLTMTLHEFHAVNDVSGLTLALDAFAQLAYQTGDPDRCARLSGFVARLESISGTGLNARNREIIGLDPSSLRDDPETAAAFLEGERMTTEDAVALALSPPAAAVTPA